MTSIRAHVAAVQSEAMGAHHIGARPNQITVQQAKLRGAGQPCKCPWGVPHLDDCEYKPWCGDVTQ